MRLAQITALLVILSGTAFADAKAESELRERLAAADKEKAALTAALAKIATENASVNRSTAVNQIKAQAAADINAAAAQNTAESNGQVARQAASEALSAANAAKVQADQLKNATEQSNRALIITLGFGFLSTLLGFVFTSWNTWRNRHWDREDIDRRDKAMLGHQQKTDVALTELKETADDTHTLVNSNMGIQLRMNAISARALAEATHRPEHERMADEAETALAEHIRKQAMVDETIATREATANRADVAKAPPALKPAGEQPTPKTGV